MRKFSASLLTIMLLLLAACTTGDKQQRLAQLEELERQNSGDAPMTDDALAEALADYFDRHGTPSERMRAHYVLGRTYADLGEAPAALSAYHDAVNSADTTAHDCEWEKLSRVYGQMAVIYHQQNLPEDEVYAIGRFIHCLQMAGDTLSSIYFLGNLVRPYYLMGEEDKVLQVTQEVHRRLKLAGTGQIHPLSLGAAIYIYTEHGQLDLARSLIELYERESGLFDREGNIADGWENFYWIKGFYELKAAQTDSAEHYFRKAIRFGNPETASNGYKGMLAVFRIRRNLDSIAHYSLLEEAALDSLHSLMHTDAISQTTALYNYNRNKSMAEEQARKSKIQRLWFLNIFIILVALFAIALLIHRRKRMEERRKLQQLEDHLKSAKSELQTVKGELAKLEAQDLQGLMAEKERRMEELQSRIAELERADAAMVNHPEDFRQSQIVGIFAKKAQFTLEHPLPSKAEWSLLVKQFQHDMPAVSNFFSKQKALSVLELHTCILLLLDFEEGAIVLLTQSSSQTVSTAKSRANMKLFGEKGAVTLKNNLNRLLLPV